MGKLKSAAQNVVCTGAALAMLVCLVGLFGIPSLIGRIFPGGLE